MNGNGWQNLQKEVQLAGRAEESLKVGPGKLVCRQPQIKDVFLPQALLSQFNGLLILKACSEQPCQFADVICHPSPTCISSPHPRTHA